MTNDSRGVSRSPDATECLNTDRELYREPPGDYYAASIHVTEWGGIGINVGGHVAVLPLRKWHHLAWLDVEQRAARGPYPLPVPGNALPTEAPSSPSDLSARETEDQQELKREREKARADGIAIENEKLVKALRAMLDVLEREGIVDMGLFDSAVCIARAALASASERPEGSPKALSDPLSPVVQENQQGAAGAASPVEDLAQLIVELVDAAKVHDALDRVRRALAAAYERGVTAGRDRAAPAAPTESSSVPSREEMQEEITKLTGALRAAATVPAAHCDSCGRALHAEEVQCDDCWDDGLHRPSSKYEEQKGALRAAKHFIERHTERCPPCDLNQSGQDCVCVPYLDVLREIDAALTSGASAAEPPKESVSPLLLPEEARKADEAEGEPSVRGSRTEEG